MSAFGEFMHGGAVDEDELQRVRDALLFEPPESRRKLSRFFLLLMFASGIATFGLLADSVATVIGAMIVAPLMLPIMGLAFGVSLGDRKAIVRSLVISLLGISVAILVGYLFTLPLHTLMHPDSNVQISTRTAPRLIDLAAALATGLAGAFATGRKDVSDTLPGVAIAISLVPPLANVGILLASQRPDLAMGSLLLFVTNYLAILLTGAFMFGLMGFPSAYLATRSRAAKRTAVGVAAVLVVVILLPLTVTSFKVVVTSMIEERTTTAAKELVKGTGYRFVSAKVEDSAVHVVVAGQGIIPQASDLKPALDNKIFGFPIELEVVPSTETTSATAGLANQ